MEGRNHLCIMSEILEEISRMEDERMIEDQDGGSKKKKNNNKYRRDKPWDNDEIDHWKEESWDPEKDRLPGEQLLEESSFATLFPKYREAYLRQVWPIVTKALDKVKIGCELNLVEGSMTVRTTRKTGDPYIILKARDLIKLLARSIPVAQAIKILNDEFYCDIIKIGGMVRNKERFVKRRQRLIGPDGATLKALELLTECYILVQGNTVSVMGPHRGIKQARMVILETMNNVHPVYNIKRLMIQRELAKDPKLANEDWERFLPKFQKKNVQRKKPLQVKKEQTKDSANKKQKKAYTPFPPAQLPSKIDLQLDSGEYFLSEHQRKAKKMAEKRAAGAIKSLERKEAKKQQYVAPTRTALTQDKVTSKKKSEDSSSLDIEKLKSKFASAGNKRKADQSLDISNFVEGKSSETKIETIEKKKKKKKKKSKE